MRIFDLDTNEYLQALAFSISKDPASLEYWHCLHVEHSEEVSADKVDTLIKKIKEEHKNADCDMVHCADNDVLFISREVPASQLYEIAHNLIDAIPKTEGKAVATLYDCFRDWRAMQTLLLSKSGSEPILRPQIASHNFGEISSLSDVFGEAKKLRKARMPLHVMIVEDDPLTRRLVTGSFKENYALITASDAEQAVANYLLLAPDIVFLDIGLPDTNGFNVLHQIMASDPDAYVVMFSGNSYLDNITSALNAGASGFIAKPFKKDRLQHYIEDSALHHHKCA
jgi:two-component system chemotaxis response regulator CheY